MITNTYLFSMKFIVPSEALWRRTSLASTAIPSGCKGSPKKCLNKKRDSYITEQTTKNISMKLVVCICNESIF